MSNERKQAVIIVICSVAALIIVALSSMLKSENVNIYEVKSTVYITEHDTVEDKDKININTADIEELTSLNGIGDTLAERIVEYRENNGYFKSIFDLADVIGISEDKVESLRGLIKVE